MQAYQDLTRGLTQLINDTLAMQRQTDVRMQVLKELGNIVLDLAEADMYFANNPKLQLVPRILNLARLVEQAASGEFIEDGRQDPLPPPPANYRLQDAMRAADYDGHYQHPGQAPHPQHSGQPYYGHPGPQPAQPPVYGGNGR
jgi:hypothetical protein